MLGGQVLIRRKEANPVISPRLLHIWQVEDIGVLDSIDKVRKREVLQVKGVPQFRLSSEGHPENSRL